MLLELRARDSWNQRDYAGARALADEAATAALKLDDIDAWWNMTFLKSECLRKLGLMRESAEVSQVLNDHPLTVQSSALTTRVATNLSFALQGCGDLAEAVIAARHAAAAAEADPEQQESLIKAQYALIAALADSDQLDEAWVQCLALAALLQGNPSSQSAGMSYWAIGNVAFLLNQPEEGTKYHRLAAENLSPTNDLELWAKFNRASAEIRLAAGVVQPETLECIDRAELAISIVGGSERDKLELALTRAHWLVLTGQYEAAAERLRFVISKDKLLATHTAAEAHLLLGRALKAKKAEPEAAQNLKKSEKLFSKAGAPSRAGSARELIDDIEPTAT
ncbi:hypothetical protein [Arthrobacter sp. Br18]|uniref:hypothetical protein n=1 Tax=Arthrobacter sp. Br18 TaxID=1312954 RepID=UPI000687B3D7|nr:hypothetical protein [Arthrobacter sp. Br18]